MKRSVATAHELHTHHFRWSQLWIHQTLELAGGAMLTLYVNHTEAVVNCNASSLVHRVVMIRVAFTNRPALPQFVLAVIYQGSGHGEGLRIHMHDTFADGV